MIEKMRGFGEAHASRFDWRAGFGRTCRRARRSQSAGIKPARRKFRPLQISRQPISRPQIRSACGSKASLPPSTKAPPIPARADQIRRVQDAIAKQQADLDRAVAQAHKSGCAGEGFFALFSALSPQCGPITSQIQQMRGNLDRSMSDLQQLQSGTTDQDGQRRALIGQLAQNNCGAQYASAAAQSRPARLLRRAVRRRHDPQSERRWRAVRHLSTPSACAPATAIISRSRTRRCRAGSPTTSVPASGCVRRRCRALFVPQSGRGHGAGGLDRRSALHRAAECLPLSQGGHGWLFLPPAGPELG